MTQTQESGEFVSSQWTLQEGAALCRAIQELPSQKFHCHPALTGGLLYKDGPRKDCDIVIYQRGDVDGKKEPIDWQGLWVALQDIGLCILNDYGYVKKCVYNGKSVDIFDPTDENSEYGAQSDADPDLAMEKAREDKELLAEVEDDLLF
jgi:hypothetical protein